jgi:hypothetical protein
MSRGTHTKRQVTQHGCLPSLLGDGDTGIEILGKIFCTRQAIEQPRLNKNLFYNVQAQQAQRTNQERTLSNVLFKSPFTSVSTVSRGHPSLVSLSTSPASQARFFDAPYRTVQRTLSLLYLHRMYSVMVNLPRLNCTQI